MRRRNSFLLQVTCVLACGSLAGSAFGGELFRVVESLALGAAEPAAVDVHRIEVDHQSLTDAELSLALPGRAAVTARRDRLERRPTGFTWRGFTSPDHRVVLTSHRGYLAGMIYAGEEAYQLLPLPDGGQGLARIDQTRFPACGGAVDPPPTLGPVPTAAPPAGGLALDPANDIDLLATYTAQSRDAAGGVAQIEATLQAAVDMANTAFIDSEMVARFDLVATALSARADSGDMGADLSWLAGDPATALLRDQVGADMVSLVVNSGSACGIGFVQRNPGPGFADSAFQVTARSCAVGNLSFAHEHGHNMGMEHDPPNGTSPANASFPWSFGHTVNGSYRTVMAYSTACSSGCTRVAHFSNPDVQHAGVPTGIAEQRDNARSGDETAPIVANFRTALIPSSVFEDGFESGLLGAWSLTVP
jgi:hypothetical protein